MLWCFKRADWFTRTSVKTQVKKMQCFDALNSAKALFVVPSNVRKLMVFRNCRGIHSRGVLATELYLFVS